jgi:hypothetical protein
VTHVFIPGVGAQKSERRRAGAGGSMFASDPSACKPPNV